jgi:hypothetical protein
MLHSPKMQRLLNEEKDGNGVSLAVQFLVEDTTRLEDWMNKEGTRLQRKMMEKFQDQIAGFSTLLEEIEL